MSWLALESSPGAKVTNVQLFTNAIPVFQTYFFPLSFCLLSDIVQCLPLPVFNSTVWFLKKTVEEHAPTLFATTTRNLISIKFGTHLEEFSC